MRNIPFEELLTSGLPREIQMKRVEQVVREELTQWQRIVLQEYYFLGKSQAQIARERKVHRSSVCRAIHRAENTLRRFLKY